MAIDGRINVDVLFHDTDGTTSLKVVSLEDSTAYTSGKVKLVSGTVGTASVAFMELPYRNAAGELVSSILAERIAFQASPSAHIANDLGHTLMVSNGSVSVDSFRDHIALYTTAGTASYTLVIYGT